MQNLPIKPSEILVGVKRTKVELDMHKYSLEREALIEKYKREGIPLHDEASVSIEKIFSSHDRQLEFRKALKKSGILKENILWAAELTKPLAKKSKAVMSCGGDWAVEIVSHKLDDKVLFMPANSDYLSSVGANTYYDIRNIHAALEKMKSGDYWIEEWIRMDVQRNGQKVQRATSTVFIGEKIRDDMSKQYVELRGIKEKVAGSGMLIVTPQGSTGWYNSCYYERHKRSGSIPKTAGHAKFFMTEPYPPGKPYAFLEGELMKGEDIIFTSLNDKIGEISIDSINHYRFNRGTVAKVRISDTNLKVIRTDA